VRTAWLQLHYKKIFFTSDRASLSIEAALCSVMISFVFIMMMSVLQYICVFCAVSKATLAVSQELSCYSAVLHESGLDSFGNTVKNRLLEKTGIAGKSSLKPLASIAGHASDILDTSVYNAALRAMISERLNEERADGKLLFPVEVVSLSGSEYFEKGSEFFINVTCRSDFMFSIPFLKIEGCTVRVSAGGNGWTSAGRTQYSPKDIDVWSLSNFKRGVVLEEIFGSNLPSDFPVIDIYNKETKAVTAIRSIDHTRDKYLEKGALEKEIKKEGDALAEFTGGEAGNIKVNPQHYKRKILLVVMPVNSLTPSQSIEAALASTYCNDKGIEVRFEYYRTSNRHSG